MTRPQSGDLNGFTLIEMLVVLCLLTIMAALALPALLTLWHQSKIRGISQETTVLMRRARLEAVKSATQVVARIVLPAGNALGKVEAFTDSNADGLLSAGEPTLASLTLPVGIKFAAPNPGSDLLGKDSVEGFSADPAGASLPKIAIFQRDGSIAIVGAYRFADTYGNYLEVRVTPAATARVEVRKARLEGSNWNFYASGEGGKAWEWK